MHLTLRQLLYFVTAVDSGTMSRAAEMLHVAPTALSQQVKAMEQAFGLALLDRHSRGIEPTRAGQELYRRGRAILDLVEEAERVITPVRKVVPRKFTVGFPPAVARMVGSEALVAAADLHDSFDLEMVEGWSGELYEQALTGEVDFVLGYSAPLRPDLRVVDLVDERFIFAVSPLVSAETGPIGLREALSYGQVFYGQKSVSWRAVHDAARAIGAEVNLVQEVSSIEVWRQLVARGVGAAITPIGAMGVEPMLGNVVVRQIEGGPVQLRISLAARRDVFEEGIALGVVPFLIDVVSTKYSQFGANFTTLLAPRVAG